MDATSPAPPLPDRALERDLAWIGGAIFPLALICRWVETPALAGAAICWAAPALAAILATAPRARWTALAAAGALAMLAGLLLGGEQAFAALERTVVYTVEAVCAGAIGGGKTGRAAATSLLAFGRLLLAVTLLPQLAGLAAAGLFALPEQVAPGALGLRAAWFAPYAGDGYAALAMFPLAMAVRREPWRRAEPRAAVVVLVLVALVATVAAVSMSLPFRPFAFNSLVLGIAALMVGPRARLLMVWVCLASAACALGHLAAPEEARDLAWVQWHLFLPGIAIAAPIQVLSVALLRLNRSKDVLARSRERFRHLYEHAPVMLQSLDAAGRTIEVNAQWLATLGHASAEGVRGTPLHHFLAPGERVDPAHPWHRRLREAAPGKLHVRLRTVDGHVIDTLAGAATAPEESDPGGGVIVAFENVSVELAMRGEMERERDRLAALTSATTDLAVFLDSGLRYRSVNRAFERYFDVSRQAVLGRQPRDVPGQGFFAEEMAAPLGRAMQGEPANFQAAIDFPLGRRIMEVALAPAFDAAGARVGAVATLHDVTDLVQATEQLRTLVAELQHANEGLEHFARIASHDLREPLNTISQFSELIEQDFGHQLPREAAHYFTLMGKASSRMKAMLDDVLQFARLERLPALSLEPIPLAGIFADLRVLLHSRLSQSGAALHVARDLPDVLGQSSLVSLLFQNLLANAMMYAVPGQVPHIEVRAWRSENLVVVSVEDDGIGIPPGELENVFLPFHRLQVYRHTAGSGLGLAISRRVATALGGRIWAESENGRGTRIQVALQAAGD